MSRAGAGGRRNRIEREEFARGHRSPGEEPAVPRPAATTIVARPGPSTGGFEVLLLERPATARFAAGAFVFPGGVIDPADAAETWRGRLPDLPNLPAGGRPACVAALRELFEETGLLVPDAPVAEAGRLAGAREALLSDEVTFDRIADELGLTFHAARMSYVARWVTPRDLRRRYDTLFFLLALPGRRHQVTITREHASAVWTTPREAMERHAEDRLPMLFPTWNTLERLAAFEGVDEAAATLGSGSIEPIEPALDIRGETVVPRLAESDEAF